MNINILPVPFASDLAAARYRAGLTQSGAADLLTQRGVRVADRTVAAWESGTNTPPEAKQRVVLGILQDAAEPTQSGPGPAAPAPSRPGYVTPEAYLARRQAERERAAPEYAPGDVFRVRLENGTTVTRRLTIVQDGPPLDGVGEAFRELSSARP